MPVTIVISFYNSLFSEALKRLLEDDRDLKIVGVFHGSASPNEITKKHPDVILSDIDTFFGLLRHSQGKDRTKMLIIYNTSHIPEMDEEFSELIASGKIGILTPDADSALLKRAIRVVHSGGPWVNRKTMQELLSRSRQQKVNVTKQERAVARYICQGYRNKEIAQKLDIAEQTVKSHCNRIYKKFGVTDRLQLAIALMQGSTGICDKE